MDANPRQHEGRDLHHRYDSWRRQVRAAGRRGRGRGAEKGQSCRARACPGAAVTTREEPVASADREEREKNLRQPVPQPRMLRTGERRGLRSPHTALASSAERRGQHGKERARDRGRWRQEQLRRHGHGRRPDTSANTGARPRTTGARTVRCGGTNARHHFNTEVTHMQHDRRATPRA